MQEIGKVYLLWLSFAQEVYIELEGKAEVIGNRRSDTGSKDCIINSSAPLLWGGLFTSEERGSLPSWVGGPRVSRGAGPYADRDVAQVGALQGCRSGAWPTISARAAESSREAARAEWAVDRRCNGPTDAEVTTLDAGG